MVFHDCEKNISEQEILIIESRLNTTFPEDFKAHYLKWNGGSPDKAVFKNQKTDEDDIEISHFIGMKYNRAFRDDPDFTLEGRVAEEWKNLEVPEYLIPYALDWYGNYVCLHKGNGKIYYYIRDVWNKRLDTAANFSNNSVLIAESLTDFLSRLMGEADDGQSIQDEDAPSDCADTVTLTFRDCEKNITEQEIRSIEDRLNTTFPENFRAHYLKWNGGIPNKTVFENADIDYDYIEISTFIAMKYARNFENNPDAALEEQAAKGWENEEIPSWLIPYALDWGGNFICLHRDDGKIYYHVRDVWSDRLDTTDNFLRNSVLIAESFADFLSCLTVSQDD